MDCLGITCPVGTVRCRAKRGSAYDYTYWLTTVECINTQGTVLLSAVKSPAEVLSTLIGSNTSDDSHSRRQISNSSGTTSSSSGNSSSRSNSSSSGDSGKERPKDKLLEKQ